MKRSLLVVMTILLFAVCLFANGAPAEAGCTPDIKANGSDVPITISLGDSLNVTFQLDPGTEAGKQGDYWLAAYTPFGFYYVSLSPISWMLSSGDLPAMFQGPLLNLPAISLSLVPGLPTGNGKYYFFFAVDTKKNGVIDFNKLYMDMVEVRVETTADSDPPSVPTGLAATVVSKSQINLSWNASTDDTGVAGYHVYRDGALIASPAAVSYNDTGLAASTTYCYRVSAYDGEANESPVSIQACATTFDASGGCGSGLPLVISDLQLPATAKSGSYVNGSVAYTGSFESIADPVVGLMFPVGVGGVITYMPTPAPYVSGCRIYFKGRIHASTDFYGKTVNVHGKVLDWNPASSLHWRDDEVSNEVSTPVHITAP